jgi:type II secretory pathway pseudopilin PulG
MRQHGAYKGRLALEIGFTFIEVVVAMALSVAAFGAAMYACQRASQIAKYQSSYEVACTYGEQAMEYALAVPYTDLSQAAPTAASPNWVSNGFFYSNATSTNLIQTTSMGAPVVLTNITRLGTWQNLSLDDLGNYVLTRWVMVQDRSAIEPTATNLNYKLISVSNTWVFLGRTNTPVVYVTIRDQP